MKTLIQFLEGRLDSQDLDYARTGGKVVSSKSEIKYFGIDGNVITITDKDKLLFNISSLFKIVAGKKVKVDGVVRIIMNDTMLKNIVSSGAKTLTLM